MTSVARRALAALVLVSPIALSACGGGSEPGASSAGGTASGGSCPTTPVDVVVSVDQWGDIVSQLGGDCAKVTTVLAGSSVDPHDYEPAPSDATLFEGAQLVVLNGGHYDEWAAKLAASSAPDAPVVDAVDLSGGEHSDAAGDDAGHADEGNPHVWYSPATVVKVAGAVTAQLKKLAPDAAAYFDERATGFGNVMKPYDDEIAAIKAGAAGKSYAATESVFDDMAAALGLQDRTPEGYKLATANESEPAPADLDAFLRLLSDRGVDVLIYNTQTEGSVPQQIRAAADKAGVAVVDVTETVPPNTQSFQTWQVDQLTSLAKALGVRG
ncbi:ABC transporter substrate-binding protein [Mycolicibacterium sp. 018/SC-01/001]|uniref:metal ABC transporter solute-binding protein, Zn/Mn family n=1 Tax=Mycolicibacterium sp. 018/SC-01/001 TaxID=2592069 RepID=UPI0011815754|nr:zinc ABC transporter substrate-binding protein [Mycolicibacterium sp. 018/SC-01/001]TRW80106.1 ABC transporter substrate-binding protein [Mycolicibacterium sp. 018/SC-01/001]